MGTGVGVEPEEVEEEERWEGTERREKSLREKHRACGDK